MKRVLFVDDDRALLDGLRSRLRSLRSRWEMVFVESGSRAIAEMEQGRFAVIVADMRMPQMDGAQLLAIVAERWPETVRIVLSGYSEEELAVRLVSIAHQYLSKPCEAHEIENVMDRCLRLHELLKEPRLRASVGRIKQLPAMPRTYTALRAAMAREDVSVSQIADIVSADPAIAAKVLQVVNSSFFRLARQIARIDQAVSYLGFTAIRNIVMSIEAFSQFGAVCSNGGFDPERLQQRARKVAATARALTEGTRLADDALLAGLLHNIGYWVLLKECPGELARSLQSARARCIPLPCAERETIGASHAEIGAYLLGLWGLPYPIVEAVAFQHAPRQVGQTTFDVLAALATAESLIAADTPIVPGVGERAETVDDDYLRSLNAPFDWAQAQQRALKAAGESSS